MRREKVMAVKHGICLQGRALEIYNLTNYLMGKGYSEKDFSELSKMAGSTENYINVLWAKAAIEMRADVSIGFRQEI